MPKILVGECKQEVSSFNPVISTYEDFDISVGSAILGFSSQRQFRDARMLRVFSQHDDIEIVPSYSVWRSLRRDRPAAASFARIGSEFMETVRNAQGRCHLSSLHGAMSAVGEDDPEGWLLAEIRKIVGEEIPIVVSLDLHGILTSQMLQHSNAIVAYHTYPHVDFYQTGERVAHLMVRILRGEAKPVTARARTRTRARTGIDHRNGAL